MPYIMNALDTQVSAQAHGKWFTFKPREIKTIHNQSLAQFMSQMRGEEGLVEVSEAVMELDKNSAEYKTAIEDKIKEGVSKRIQKLDSIKRNLLGSLRFDVEAKGIKADPLTFASKGELEALKELNTLKKFEAEQQLNTADQIRKLLEGTQDGSSGDTNTGTIDTRSSDSIKPAQSRKQ